MKTVVCANGAGGQGRSMLSTHLAFLAAELGYKVLAVDLDSTRTLSINLLGTELNQIGPDVSPTLSLFRGKICQPSPLSFSYPIAGSVRVMTGDRRLADVDGSTRIAPTVLRERLVQVGGDADLVVLDPPPGLGKRVRAALVASDFVVMPFVPSREGIDGLGDLLETIAEVIDCANPCLQTVGFLPNSVNSRDKFQAGLVKDLQAATGGVLPISSIRRSVGVCEAMAVSRPVWRGARSGSQRRAASEVHEACRYILESVWAGLRP